MVSSEFPTKVAEKAQQIALNLSGDPVLTSLIDLHWPIPKPYLGSGEIRLFILGQDPTVKKAEDRARIKICLNLDRRGNMVLYLSGVCQGLGLELRTSAYATNYIKNFFVRPPTQINETNVLMDASQYWLPLLQEELRSFPDTIVISLGEPLLSLLTPNLKTHRLRDYWGYNREWKDQGHNSFSYIKANENILNRNIYPFPHQPSLRKEFYKRYMYDYVAYTAKGKSDLTDS